MNKAYPGRACMAPLLDVLMTLLHMGAAGWRDTLRAREASYVYLRERLCEVAAEHGAFASVYLRGSRCALTSSDATRGARPRYARKPHLSGDDLVNAGHPRSSAVG